jgi:hypothetical protein
MSTILITPIVLLFVIETDARWRQFIIATAAIGAIGCLITIVLWIIRPQILMKWRRRRLNTNRHNHQIIDREHTETVMKMLSGIPYLIQVDIKLLAKAPFELYVIDVISDTIDWLEMFFNE